MITANTLRVTSEVDSSLQLHLAPYGVEELAQYIPEKPDDLLPYEKMVYNGGPEKILQADARPERIVSWGLYDGAPSLDTFAGKLHLGEHEYGEPQTRQYTKLAQAIGASIIAPEKRGKSLEVPAILAAVRYAIETDGTCVFVAETPERNLGSRAFLEEVGFAHVGTHSRYMLPDGEQTQYWMLANPTARELFLDSKKLMAHAANREQISEAVDTGWRRFYAAAGNLKLELM